MVTVFAIKTFNQELLSGIAPGTWVAVSEDQERVVGKAMTVEGALEEAKRAGEEHPFVIRVPQNDSGLIL